MVGMRKDTRESWARTASRLRGARIAQTRTLANVAAEIGATGTMLRKWESGTGLPSAPYFIAWVQALGFYLDITDAEEES